MPLYKNKEDIINLLRKHKQQITSSRIAICTIVLAPHTHITAEEAQEKLQKTFPHISLATIYNTLNMLVQINAIQEIKTPSSGKTIYDSTIDPHFHFYDTKKNKIYDLDTSQIKLQLNSIDQYNVDKISIVLEGTCK